MEREGKFDMNLLFICGAKIVGGKVGAHSFQKGLDFYKLVVVVLQVGLPDKGLCSKAGAA